MRSDLDAIAATDAEADAPFTIEDAIAPSAMLCNGVARGFSSKPEEEFTLETPDPEEVGTVEGATALAPVPDPPTLEGAAFGTPLAEAVVFAPPTSGVARSRAGSGAI